jgi:hypothetical protein
LASPVKKGHGITADEAGNGIAFVTVIIAQNAAPGQTQRLRLRRETQADITVSKGGKPTV